MTIEDFMDLMIDGDSQHFHIWNNNKCEVIFDGEGSEIPCELLYEEISSIDNVYWINSVYSDCNGILTLNVDIKE